MFEKKKEKLKEGLYHIIVGTSGRLKDMI